MTTPTLIVTPPSPPAPSYSANRVPQPSLMDKIKKIAAIASLILIGTTGFLALLGHLVGFLIAPQITIVLLALFIISLAGNALYLQKTANLHLYQDLQREVGSLKEINFMLCKDLEITIKVLNLFWMSIKTLQKKCANFFRKKS